jgi:hypothetical protein
MLKSAAPAVTLTVESPAAVVVQAVAVVIVPAARAGAASRVTGVETLLPAVVAAMSIPRDATRPRPLKVFSDSLTPST